MAAFHGEDTAEAMALLAERMIAVWREHPDLQAEVIASIEAGDPIDDLLARFAEVAGLPKGYQPPPAP